MPAAAHIGSKLTNNSTITGPGSTDVLVNGLPASKVGDDVSDGHTMVTGSPDVLVNGVPMVRFGDADSNGHTVSTLVSTDVFVDGP